MLRIYLDNCCFNRPYDDQTQITISLETSAKIHIQNKIKVGEYELIWSFILFSENEDNPFIDRKSEIRKWASLATHTIQPDNSILNIGKDIQRNYDIDPNDALHIACAISGNCDYFLTTDKKLIKRASNLKNFPVISPVKFIEILNEG